jgi:hypothetical protein
MLPGAPTSREAPTRQIRPWDVDSIRRSISLRNHARSPLEKIFRAAEETVRSDGSWTTGFLVSMFEV